MKKYEEIFLILQNITRNHINNNHIKEQKGCRKQSQEYKEQLIIDSITIGKTEKETETFAPVT